MITYLSTFISGFADLIKSELPKSDPQAQIVQILDGLIVYRSPHRPEKIPYFNNSFVLWQQSQPPQKKPLDWMLDHLCQDGKVLNAISKYPRSGKSFRIRTLASNQPTAVNSQTLKRAIVALEKATGIPYQAARADIEFHLLYRSEGSGFFVEKISLDRITEKHLSAGELKPELTYLLCALSDPQAKELFLDPFCGSGAIVSMRNSSFPPATIIASDQDRQRISGLRSKFKNSTESKKIVVKNYDARKLYFIKDKQIDKIVSDPPWGFFSRRIDIPTLYNEFLQEAQRILKPAGLMIILTAQKEVFEKELNDLSQFQLLEKYDILVSGKKAAIYQIQKK